MDIVVIHQRYIKIDNMTHLININSLAASIVVVNPENAHPFSECPNSIGVAYSDLYFHARHEQILPVFSCQISGDWSWYFCFAKQSLYEMVSLIRKFQQIDFSPEIGNKNKQPAKRFLAVLISGAIRISTGAQKILWDLLNFFHSTLQWITDFVFCAALLPVSGRFVF